MGNFDNQFIICYFLIAILQALPISCAASNGNSRLFKEVKINGGDADCSTAGKNYKSVTFSSVLSSATIPCANICRQEDACVVFDTKGNVCTLYNLTLSATTPCAMGASGTRAYTKHLGRDIALYKFIDASTIAPGNIALFSELTSNRTSYNDNHLYCPCTQVYDNSWIRVDLGQTYKITRVDVTVSFQLRETYFRTVSVHIGDTGLLAVDPLVGGKDSRIPAPLELYKFYVTGTGRYVILQQLETNHFCCCKIQIYGY
ncbi:uncharacterized protein LOC135213435 [Macrobrachium nipponense]|uniref:uncharacterized protein LOC135213435 n=1 Tax=Macrobrachium nipponense TaxID=159736 RepID=UPI0030C8BEDF